MFNPFKGSYLLRTVVAIKSLFLAAASREDALTVPLVYQGALCDSKPYDNDQVNCIANVLRFHLHKYSSVFLDLT